MLRHRVHLIKVGIHKGEIPCGCPPFYLGGRTLKRKQGRPRELYGPLITVKLNALTHIHLQAMAKEKGKTMSQTVRDTLRDAIEKDWGPICTEHV